MNRPSAKPGVTQKLVRVVCASSLVLLAHVPDGAAQGHVEFGVHYGKWSLNLLGPAIEALTNDYAEMIKDKQVDKIQELNPTLRETSFLNQVAFDSSGNNLGFEVRWYPGGEHGSFSIGLAGEKASMTIGVPTVSTALTLQDDKTGARYTFNSNASGQVDTKPFAVLMTFRWDILPSRRIHPYISIGGGAAGVSALDNTSLSWNYSGTLASPGLGSVTIADGAQKTLRQVKIEEDFDYPVSLFPFVQLNVGLKANIAKSLYILIDAGVLNGFVLRGGLAFRL